jgi:hypothetical protein
MASSSLLEVACEALERMTPNAVRPMFRWCATPASILWTLRLPGRSSGGIESVLSSKIGSTQAILGDLLKFEAREADNGIKTYDWIAVA